jgi:hypothetical protein
MEKEVIAWNPPTDWVKEQIEAAGTKIGSVHFNKRKGGELRKMSYRLHVTSPSTATAPKGMQIVETCDVCGKKRGVCQTGPFTKSVVQSKSKSKKDIDAENTQLTVLDTNKVVRDKDGNIVGRGAWRTVPLENVVRIANNGTTYTIKRY